jgi:hypothetical protein
MEKNLVTLVAWHFIIVYVLLIFDTARHAGKILGHLTGYQKFLH